MVVMRSVFYVPGNNYRFIEKAPALPADIIVLDLEDSVPPAEKETARFMVKDSIKNVKKGGADVYVRLNCWATELTEGDLDETVQEGLDGVVLSKTSGKDDVIRLEKKLEELEKARGITKPIAMQLLIETAKGVVNMYEASTASKRVNSLVFGAVDFTRDMRVKMTKEATETMVARAWLPIVARAAGLIAIDNPWPPFEDVEGFIKDTKFGRQLGYEGRMLIHPNQIEHSNQIYAPNKEDVDYAREVVEVFKKGMAEGKAAVPLRGTMIDWAVYLTQKDVLSMAETMAEREQNRKKSL